MMAYSMVFHWNSQSQKKRGKATLGLRKNSNEAFGKCKKEIAIRRENIFHFSISYCRTKYQLDEHFCLCFYINQSVDSVSWSFLCECIKLQIYGYKKKKTEKQNCPAPEYNCLLFGNILTKASVDANANFTSGFGFRCK